MTIIKSQEELDEYLRKNNELNFPEGVVFKCDIKTQETLTASFISGQNLVCDCIMSKDSIILDSIEANEIYCKSLIVKNSINAKQVKYTHVCKADEKINIELVMAEEGTTLPFVFDNPDNAKLGRVVSFKRE